MRFNFSLVLAFITISVGMLIVCVNEVSGTDIIILKSADENENPNLSPDQPEGSQSQLEDNTTTTKRVFSPEMGGLCSSAELTARHRHRRHNQSCSCRRILCPVCGTDENSYANLCYLNCQKLIHTELNIAYNGRCKSRTPTSTL